MLSVITWGVVAVSIAYFLNTIWLGLTSNLSKIPGPWHSKYTNAVLRYHILTGRRIFYVDQLHHIYGQVVRIAPDEVSVADLDGFSKIHKIGSGFLKSDWYKDALPDNPGIFNMQDPHQHSSRRKLFARAFSNSSLRRNWESEIRLKAELAVQKIKQDAQNGKADLLKWWTLMATDVIAHLNFGESFDMLKLGKQTAYIDALQSALLGSVLRAEIPLVYMICRILPIERIRKYTTANEIVHKYGSHAIRNMRSQQGNAQNLFGQMLAESDAPEKEFITDEDVRIEAANLIVAGSDTTAVSLTYLVWAVLKDPVLQSKLEEEIENLSEDLTLDELEKAPILNSVIEETLRLYGAAPGALPRTVPEQGTQINGHQIPPKTVVTTQAYTLHRDPTIFPDPLRFDGLRFIEKSNMTVTQKTAFHPFGAGSRICLGIHLAWMELRMAAALFFRHCRGAKISQDMTDAMMEMDNRFLIVPKGHCCNVTL